jgi:hypothetical protein
MNPYLGKPQGMTTSESIAHAAEKNLYLIRFTSLGYSQGLQNSGIIDVIEKGLETKAHEASGFYAMDNTGAVLIIFCVCHEPTGDDFNEPETE